MLYALLGRRRALLAAHATSTGLLLAGIFFSWSWLIWWFLTRFVVGLGHPAALVEEPLGPGRRAIAVLSLAPVLRDVRAGACELLTGSGGRSPGPLRLARRAFGAPTTIG